jgi:hypothetical protein
MSSLAEIIRDLLIFVGAMFALLVLLVLIISRLPDSNPLKAMLTALSYRVGATFAAGALAIPIEPIPGLDAAYDIVAPLGLLYYWWTFARGVYRSTRPPSQVSQMKPTRRLER